MSENTVAKTPEEPDSSATSVHHIAAYNVIAAMREALKAEATAITTEQAVASEPIDPFAQEENENYILVLVKNFFVERSPRPHHLGDNFVEHFLNIRND